MATQAALNGAEWQHGPQGPTSVQCVFRRVQGGWEPWVIVAQSAIMQRVGRRGLGLYAARSFKQNDFLGRYDGSVKGTFANRDAALASAACRKLVQKGHDKLITRNLHHGGVELVDGETGGPPFLHRMNDPRGTQMKANVHLTPGGWVRVAQLRVPAFDLQQGLDANIKAELRLEYGKEYWKMMDGLGTNAAHAIEVD